MENLWVAILFYSVGLGLVLHFRPAAMFHANGNWKEFGYKRDSRHTLFPFWLFAITWAFVSYAMAAVFTAIIPVASVAGAVATSFTSEQEEEQEQEQEEEEEVAIPVSQSKSSKNKPRAGYYVLDPKQAASGLRKYIYYGPNKPENEV